MKHLLRAAVGLALLPTLCPWPCLAQQPGARPVIPVPTPAPAAEAPLPTPPPALPDQSPAQTPDQTPAQPALQNPLPSAAQLPASTPTQPPAQLPPAAQTGGPLPVNASQASASYLIGPEDAITVNVWREPTVSGSFAVRPDGMISLPLLGDVLAAGLSPMALSNDLSTRLKKYLTDPLVTVTVTAVNSKRFYLIGEVGRPGALPLSPGMTPMEAIAAAGGLGPYANAKKIYILRTQNGKQVKIPFNYKQAIKDGNQQGVTLAPGDTIVVP